jgi:hypothetical protein
MGDPTLRRRRAAAVIAGSVACLGVATAVVGAAVGDGPAPAVTLRVLGGHAGRAVPPGFVGFSFEYASVPTYFGGPAQPNLAFVALMRSLARAQHAPPVVRIGGNSADVSWWDPTGAPGPRQLRTNLGPRWMSSLTTIESRIRMPLTLTVDLALERPGNALAFVRAARAAVPPGAVGALEIGNEPDLYARRTTTAHGVLAPPRFPTLARYTPGRYRADVAAYASALSGGLSPTPPLVVGAFGGQAWNAVLPAVLRRAHGEVRRVSVHAYPLHGCRHERGRHETVAGLLSPASSHGLAVGVARAIRMSGLRPAAARVGEMNSVTCGGMRGVSDTFASALWLTDVLFELQRIGVSGINAHSLVGAPYAPFTFMHTARAGWRAQARPLYYGLLLFAEAAPAGSRTLRLVQHPASGIRAWATTDRRHTLRVTVINPSSTTARTVLVAAPRSAARRPPVAAVIRLQAPSARSRGGVTLGGQQVGPDGRLHGGRLVARVSAVRGRYRLSLPAASAALITVRH